MKIKSLFLVLASALLAVRLFAAPGVTATLTPSNAYLLPAGGTVTLTANITGYPDTTSALGWSVVLPDGWSYAGGSGEPAVKPISGATGVLEWAYVALPESGSFTFTVAYPSGITSSVDVASSVIVRYSGEREEATVGNVTLLPATAPAITNEGPWVVTYGESVSFAIAATSPIDIISYDIIGLPAGLSRNGATISGVPTVTGTFPLTLQATNAAGTGTKQVTLTVDTALALIAFANLAQVYDGTPKSATASTTPAGLPVTITYDGQTTPPTNAGTYEVVAMIDTLTHSAMAGATLTIARATQTIAFADPGEIPANAPVTLAATSTSGQPVEFALQSGDASLDGATLTIRGVGAVVVRASVAASANYEAAFAERSFNSSKLSQTIAFEQPSDMVATDEPFALSATATSGLPVSFNIMSGPAMLSGNIVTLTGVAGTVRVRATQPGDATYHAAPEVVREFSVTAESDRVYFGDMISEADVSLSDTRFARSQSTVLADALKVGEVAAVLSAGGNSGSLLIVAPALEINDLVEFTLAEDGSFTATVQQGGATPTTRTIRGQLSGATFSGGIDGIGVSFSTQVQPPGGPSAEVAGFYRSSALETAEGVTYTVVGTNNNVLVLAITPTMAIGGASTLLADGNFEFETSVATGESVIVQGAIDAPTTTVSGAILIPNQAPIEFAGLLVGNARTDRLISLSSRGRVGAGENILINGVVIGGTEPKLVLIRAVGPGLTEFGVNDTLIDPRISLFKGATLIAENDNWATADTSGKIAAAAQRIGAFSVPKGSKDAMLLQQLAPGAYTVHVHGGEGVALAEIYDASENPQSEYQRLVAISTRGKVGLGENVLIGGLAITGNSPKRVLIRGVGPGLSALGVSDVLADPVLRVYRGNTVIGENDNWSADAAQAGQLVDAEAATGAFRLEAGSKDAAILMTLAPGNYTVHVAGVNGTTGVALVEIYEMVE